MNPEINLQEKSLAARLGKLVFSFSIIGLLAVSSVMSYQFVASLPNIPRAPNTGAGANIGIAYPTSTNLCINGCEPHQNWIRFYLPLYSYQRNSFRLRTSLFLGQLLTIGISGSRCRREDKTGYSCVDMELSHRLLAVLTGTGLAPLSQLRDTNNWWLEYTPQQ